MSFRYLLQTNEMRSALGSKKTLVLGLGNPLFGDDAFGSEVVRCLSTDTDFCTWADVIEVGTDLLDFVDKFAEYEVVVLVDSAMEPEKAGKMLVLGEEDLEEWLSECRWAHSLSAAMVCALFRTLHPDSQTRIFIVARCTSELAIASKSFDAKDVLDGANLVRKICERFRGARLSHTSYSKLTVVEQDQ